MKTVQFCGSALADLRAFPDDARRDAGYQLDRVQNGLDPADWKPMSSENMKLRATLMMALDGHIRAKGWTQTEAARRFGVTQPRVSDLLRGKINLFAIDALVNMAVAAGLHVELTVQEAA